MYMVASKLLYLTSKEHPGTSSISEYTPDQLESSGKSTTTSRSSFGQESLSMFLRMPWLQQQDTIVGDKTVS